MRDHDERRRPWAGDASRPAGATEGRIDDRWGVILAGGAGSRLLPLTRLIAGDDRPKQFCSLLGPETLLDDTRRRAALVVHPSHMRFVLTKEHERFYAPLLSDVPGRQLVVQPANAGTAAAVLYCLMRLRREGSSGSVAFFPSDHYVSDAAAFMAHVERAIAATGRRGDLVVLIGIPPKGAETEYGWIEPAQPGLVDEPGALRWILRFWEKPELPLARALVERGGVWNSFVMVGQIDAFLGIIREAAPDLYRRFEAVESSLGGDDEEHAIRALYAELPMTNFSTDVLAARPAGLAVLVANGVTWSDLGRPDRALARMLDSAGSDVRKYVELPRAAAG